MESKQIIADDQIKVNLEKSGWDVSVKEGRLMLLELLSKAAAGYYNSHTEEGYMVSFGLLRKNRELNKKGLKFIMSMVYKYSGNRPDCFELMREFRV